MQFLKALGHGSWNECLENRLVFSSPLRSLASFGWYLFPSRTSNPGHFSTHTSTIYLYWFAPSWVSSLFRPQIACQQQIDHSSIITCSVTDTKTGQLTEERRLHPKVCFFCKLTADDAGGNRKERGGCCGSNTDFSYKKCSTAGHVK